MARSWKEALVSPINAATPMTLLRDGIRAARANDKARARECLREVTRVEPANEHGWLWLAGVAETPETALQCLQRVLDINPDNAQARKGLATTRLHMGIAEAKAGRKRTARRLLLEVVKHDAENEHAWLWLAGVAETPQDGLAYLDTVLEINPGNAHARTGVRSLLLQAGMAEARAGNKEAARHHLRTAVERDPEHEQAWHWLAGVVDDPAEAVACLERVLELNPANSHAQETLRWHRTRLDAAARQWQCPLCQESAAEPVDVCPACHALLALDDPDAFFTTVALRTDRVEEAVARFEAALAKGSDFATQYNLGLAYLNLQRPDPALDCFQEALLFLPEHKELQVLTRALVQRKAAADERARIERAQQPAVLVIDDSPTVRKLVALTLEKEGFRVAAAADGEEGLRSVGDEVPDLILLDITMPGKDGYQVCKALRANRETSLIPVVMLSGKDGFFDKLRGRLAGSTEYVTKPFKSETLIQVVRRHCRKK
jgi:twitching motility two-component system response regulator PilG